MRFRAEAVTDDPDTHDLLRELNEIGFFRIGLNYLSPGQHAVSFFTNVSENHNGKLASRFKIHVFYKSDTGRAYKDEYLIDLGELEGLRRVSPAVEYYSIDEMFFDAGELPAVFGKPLPEAARALQRRLLEEVGVPVSIGLSRSRALAKLGSDSSKPLGCLVLLERGEIEADPRHIMDLRLN